MPENPREPQKGKATAPIIAAVLLLLPVLYVGSYLALVTPGGTPFVIAPKGPPVTAWPIIEPTRMSLLLCFGRWNRSTGA
jgi:hypothetical protein